MIKHKRPRNLLVLLWVGLCLPRFRARPLFSLDMAVGSPLLLGGRSRSIVPRLLLPWNRRVLRRVACIFLLVFYYVFKLFRFFGLHAVHAPLTGLFSLLLGGRFGRFFRHMLRGVFRLGARWGILMGCSACLVLWHGIVCLAALFPLWLCSIFV